MNKIRKWVILPYVLCGRITHFVSKLNDTTQEKLHILGGEFRREEEDSSEEEVREQESKRIEEDIKKLGEQKWYLKSKIIYVLCFITPPIGYVYVFLLRKKMTEDAKQTYLIVATIMMALWSLKFLPPYVLAGTVVVVACLVFIVKFVK